MNLTEKDEELQLKIRINRGRYVLLFMIILSAINVVTVITNGSSMMPFSSAISTYSCAYAMFLKDNTPFFILGFAIAFIALLSLIICYIKSKKNIVFLVISMCFVIVDTLVLIICGYSYVNMFVPDLVLHAMTVYYFFNGIKAHKALLSANDDTAPTAINDPGIEINDTLEDNEDNDIFEPISEYCDDGTPPLVSGEINGLTVFAVIRDNMAELVVNNRVCDKLKIDEYDEFDLRVIVNDIDICFQYKRNYGGEAMYLYADDELLDSFGRR